MTKPASSTKKPFAARDRFFVSEDYLRAKEWAEMKLDGSITLDPTDPRFAPLREDFIKRSAATESSVRALGDRKTIGWKSYISRAETKLLDLGKGIGERFKNLAWYGRFDTDAGEAAYIERLQAAYEASPKQFRNMLRYESPVSGTKALIETVASGGVGPLARFGVFGRGSIGVEGSTRLFENRFPADVLERANIIPTSQLKNINGTFNYVVTKEGNLVVGRASDLPGGGHIDLAGARPVQAAGEVRIVGGQIKYLDNSSSHYLPVGSSAQVAAEKAFNQLGFNSTGRYLEKAWIEDPKLPRGGAWRQL